MPDSYEDIREIAMTAAKRSAEILAGSTVHTSTTIGFPHGGHTTVVKEREAEQAIADGCQELDMVVNISQVLSENWDYVQREIAAINRITHDAGQKLKVIFENCFLENHHKRELCRICGELSVDWVKTSTGYGSGGATLEDLRLMRESSPEHVQVKAAGGVRDIDALLQVREIGVTRVGSSRTPGILDPCRERLGLDPIKFEAQASTGGY